MATLLKQFGEVSVTGTTFEQVLLRVDFWLMKASFGISRRFSEARARAALVEMCQIVDHLANTFGERVVAVPTAK